MEQIIKQALIGIYNSIEKSIYILSKGSVYYTMPNEPIIVFFNRVRQSIKTDFKLNLNIAIHREHDSLSTKIEILSAFSTEELTALEITEESRKKMIAYYQRQQTEAMVEMQENINDPNWFRLSETQISTPNPFLGLVYCEKWLKRTPMHPEQFIFLVGGKNKEFWTPEKLLSEFMQKNELNQLDRNRIEFELNETIQTLLLKAQGKVIMRNNYSRIVADFNDKQPTEKTPTQIIETNGSVLDFLENKAKANRGFRFKHDT
jgi:hypothetical protein